MCTKLSFCSSKRKLNSDIVFFGILLFRMCFHCVDELLRHVIHKLVIIDDESIWPSSAYHPHARNTSVSLCNWCWILFDHDDKKEVHHPHNLDQLCHLDLPVGLLVYALVPSRVAKSCLHAWIRSELIHHIWNMWAYCCPFTKSWFTTLELC